MNYKPTACRTRPERLEELRAKSKEIAAQEVAAKSEVDQLDLCLQQILQEQKSEEEEWMAADEEWAGPVEADPIHGGWRCASAYH